MASKKSLLSQLKQDFPEFSFAPSDHFRWSAAQQTIFYPRGTALSAPTLLHEVGHGILQHTQYTQDIELISMERAAWEQALTVLAPRYGVTLLEGEIEQSMETYREWLHARSLCPQCKQSGLHTKTDTYQCLNCRCQWRANDARFCLLRRQIVKRPAQDRLVLS